MIWLGVGDKPPQLTIRKLFGAFITYCAHILSISLYGTLKIDEEVMPRLKVGAFLTILVAFLPVSLQSVSEVHGPELIAVFQDLGASVSCEGS